MTIFIGRETKTHILPTKINEKKIAKVSPSNNNYSFRIISPFNNNNNHNNHKGLGLTASLASGRRRGTSGTPWNRLSTPCSSFRRLMFLCRKWRTNWWRCAGSSMFAFLSRSSKCPRSHLHPVIAGAVCALLSRRQNSWWKCRRSSLILLCCSGLWSRTLPFQLLLVVEGETQIFKVFSVDRVQQRSLRLWNAFLSRLWSRSLTSPLLVEILTIFAQDRVHPQLRTLQLLGSTLTFSRKKKVRLSPGT